MEGTFASNLLQHATKLHSVRPSCSTCRRPVKSGKSTNLISATVHLGAGSAVCGEPADVVRWGPSDTELQLRGLTTKSCCKLRKEGYITRPKRGNHFTASQTVIVLSAVLQPERAAAIRPQSVCVNYFFERGVPRRAQLRRHWRRRLVASRCCRWGQE